MVASEVNSLANRTAATDEIRSQSPMWLASDIIRRPTKRPSRSSGAKRSATSEGAIKCRQRYYKRRHHDGFADDLLRALCTSVSKPNLPELPDARIQLANF